MILVTAQGKQFDSLDEANDYAKESASALKTGAEIFVCKVIGKWVPPSEATFVVIDKDGSERAPKVKTGATQAQESPAATLTGASVGLDPATDVDDYNAHGINPHQLYDIPKREAIGEPEKPKRGRPKKAEEPVNLIQTRAEPIAVTEDHNPFSDLDEDKKSPPDPNTIVITDPATGGVAVGDWVCPACAKTMFASCRKCLCGQVRPELGQPITVVAQTGVRGVESDLVDDAEARQQVMGEKIMAHRVGNLDAKCLRCGADTLWALCGAFRVRICSNSDCVVSPETAATYMGLYKEGVPHGDALPGTSDFRGEYDPEADDNANEVVKAGRDRAQTHNREDINAKAAARMKSNKVGDSDETCPRCGDETLWAGSAGIRTRICPNEGCVIAPDTDGEIPPASEVTTSTVCLGMLIQEGPKEWEDQPITEVNEDGTGGGQLKALNTGLSSIGYGDALRHPACVAVLGQVRQLGSLKELTRAEAHLLLSWIRDCGPQQLADLARLVKPKAATGVVI